MNLMPGWFPGGAAAAKAGVTSITQVLSATSAAATITAPAGILAGDLLVLLDAASGLFTPPTAITPTGFTNLSNVGGTTSSLGARQMLSCKLAVGNESSTSITGMSGLASLKAMYVFRGNIPATLLTPGTANGEYSGGNPSAQNVAASGASPPLVVLGGYGLTGLINPRTMSPAKDGEINPNTSVYLAYKIYNSSPADVSVDMDDEGDGNALQSCYIQMA